MSSSQYGRKFNSYRCLREPFGTPEVGGIL